jgi:hypothetical protein
LAALETADILAPGVRWARICVCRRHSWPIVELAAHADEVCDLDDEFIELDRTPARRASEGD